MMTPLHWQPEAGGWYAGSPQSDPPGEPGCPDWGYYVDPEPGGRHRVWLMKMSTHATDATNLGQRPDPFATLAEAQAWCEAREVELRARRR